MSYFSGVTFSEQRVTPSDDGAVRETIFADGIIKRCSFQHSGTTLSMSEGMLIVHGRLIRHTAAEDWAVVDATSGYARLVLTIDLTLAASKDLFEQVYTEIQYATAIDGFPELTQEDINTAGSVYQVALCVVALGTSGITGIVSHLPAASSAVLKRLGGASLQTATASLSATLWSGSRQTVSVSGVTADNVIIPAPDPTNYDAYYDANVRCTAQAEGKLTFVCDSVPDQELLVNVLILS